MSLASNVVLAAPSADNIFVLSQQAVADAAKRELLSKERAQELLRPLLQPRNNVDSDDAPHPGHAVHKLVLGGKSFGSESAPVLAEALQATPALRHADFADCIASRPTDEALDTLQQLCDAIGANERIQLTHLDLSDNALGVRGIPKIKNAFKGQSQLQHLFFNNDGLQAEAVRGLTDLIMEAGGGAKTTQLRTFEIASNCLEDAGFLALIPLVQASPLLQKLRIATTRVRNNQGAGIAMARTLLGLHHLTSLSLNDNNLGEEAGHVLAQVIEQNKRHLSFLNLGDIGVEIEGVEAIMRAVAHIRKGVLTHLDLSASELSTPTHAARLVSIIRRQASSLQHLKLEDNELRSGGASKLLRALTACKRLEYLNLSNNHLGNRCLSDVLAFISAAPALRELHINGNRFSDDALQQIRDALAATDRADALATVSDNDEEDESDEDEDEADELSEDAADEEEEDAKPAAAAAALAAAVNADEDIDALAADLAATSVSKA
jgi:Ran GTPase-activating protein (RanGAP) involved in mRNA processing and transport